MLMVLAEEEFKQNYEVCQEIEKGFVYIENLINIKYPRELNKDVIEDYVACFWKNGLSGNTAMENMDFYVLETRKMIGI